LGLGKRELVAFTGAGGKSTLMLGLADELAGMGSRILVTTTTKMGRDQLTDVPAVCESEDLEAVAASLALHPFVALITGGDDHKATGPSPEIVDGLFRAAPLEYLLVEADGAHGRSLKAPASHEPVIPSAATAVVILFGLDAVGGRIAEVAHRPAQAARLTGLEGNDRLTIEHCVAVLTHPEGGLKGVPPAARVVVALTKAGEAGGDPVAIRIAQKLGYCQRISDVVVV
jgi:molybdenum cofactor cytidylyltransferase